MLPELPKKNNKKEADLGLTFRAWWDKNPLGGPFELKHTRGKNTFLYSELSPEQEAIGLRAISKKGVLVRRSAGTVGASDYDGYVNSPYWIVIRFPKCWVIISLSTLLLERKNSKTKSLRAERASEIALVTVH